AKSPLIPLSNRRPNPQTRHLKVGLGPVPVCSSPVLTGPVGHLPYLYTVLPVARSQSFAKNSHNRPEVVSSTPMSQAPSDRSEFTRLVRGALNRLHDPVYLSRHPLARLVSAGDARMESGSQSGLREQLLHAIELLKPDRQ